MVAAAGALAEGALAAAAAVAMVVMVCGGSDMW